MKQLFELLGSVLIGTTTHDNLKETKGVLWDGAISRHGECVLVIGTPKSYRVIGLFENSVNELEFLTYTFNLQRWDNDEFVSPKAIGFEPLPQRGTLYGLKDEIHTQ